MEKENKYYTPSADEFISKLPFEMLLGNGEWVKGNDVIIKPSMSTQSLRVKYIDQSDLESLGWKFTKINDYIFSGDGSSMIFELTNNEYSKWQLLLFENYNEVWIDFIHEPTAKKLSYFKGKIKNINELKKLMKQLNII
jgi:uncharacterized protein YydD (DUF2326 family)